MKKLLLILLTLILAVGLVSCKKDKNSSSGSNSGDSSDSGNGASGGVQIVYNQVPYELISEIMESVYDKSGVAPTLGNDGSSAKEYEIVFGKSDRAVSKKAYQALSRIDKDDESLYYFVVYAEGNSVAIAYEEDKYGSDATMVCAKDYFVNIYFNGLNSITASSGVVHTEGVDPIEWQRDVDSVKREEEWQKLAEIYGSELIDEAKKYYTLISPEIVRWMANLYDPETGGFYYSNSSRNTIGYLPDVESTFQIIEFLSETGVLAGIDGDPSRLPETMKNALVGWIKSMQNENGYFYHPQWTKEAVDRQLSRKGRDLKYAVQILSWCSASPTYDTPDGVKGDGILADGTPVQSSEPEAVSYLTARLENLGAVSSVSKLVRSSVAAVSSNYPEIMKDAESFYAYLKTLDIRKDAYEVGNELSSQAGQIKYRDKKLTEAGEDSLIAVLEKWLNENQNPENGTWYFVSKSTPGYSVYSAVNGLLKISSLYNAVGIRMNYVDEAIETAIEGILSDETVGTACHPYNPWFAINNIFENLKTFSTNKEETESKISKIRERLLADGPNVIRTTFEKVLTLLKDDGTFSYFPNEYKGVSQGMSVSVPGVVEGDVNATIICAFRTPKMMFEALGINVPDAFGLGDWYLFSDMIEEMGEVVKDKFVEREDPITFDDDEKGELSSDISFVTASNGSFEVEADPRPNKKGKVLAFRSLPGGTDNLYVYCESAVVAPCYIFEADMSISANSTGSIASIYIGQCYLILLKIEGGRVYFYDSSSDKTPKIDIDLCGSVALDTWFNLKVEYYMGTHDSVRAKMYINDELISVSDNYYDRDGIKITEGSSVPSAIYSYARIIAFKNADISILLDDVIVRKSYKTYKPASDPNNQPPYNVDPPEKEQIIYDFEDVGSGDSYPSDFIVNDGGELGNVVENNLNGQTDKLLAINKVSGENFDISIPINVRSKYASAYVFAADLLLKNAGVGDVFDISLRAGSDTNVTLIRASVIEEGNEKYLLFYNAPASVTDGQIRGVKVKLGEGFELRTEYYPAKKMTLIYVNGTAVAWTDRVCSNSEGVTVSELNISAIEGSAFELWVDDLVAEYREADYDIAVENLEIKIHDFENGISSSAETDGTLKKEQNGNSYVNLGQNKSLAVTFDKCSPFANCYTAGFDFVSFGTGGTLCISLKDSSNRAVLTLEIRETGGELEIYEITSSKSYDAPIATVRLTGRMGFEIKFYPSVGEAVVYVNDSAVAVSSLVYSSESDAFGVARFVINNQPTSASVSVDNLFAACKNEIYERPEVSENENIEDNESNLDFEGSSTGSLPSNLGFATVSGKLNIVERITNGSDSKWLALRSYNGSYDKITFITSDTKTAENNTAVFESEIYIQNKSKATPTYEIYLTNSYGQNAYLLLFRLNGNKIQIRDISGSSDTDVPGRILGEWTNTEAGADAPFKLRIEYTFGDSDSVKIITYVNDKVALVSDNYYGKSTVQNNAPSSNVDSAYLCAYKATEAVMYLDNLSLTYKTVIEKVPQKTYDFEDGIIPEEYFSLNTSTGGVSATMGVVKDNDAANGSNVIEYKSNSSSPASRFIVTSCYDEKSANTYVFEADIKCDFGNKNYFYVDLLNGTKTVYSLVFKNNGNEILFYDVESSSATSSPYGSVSVEKGWFNLRIEYCSAGGDKDSLTFKTYINGVLVYESDNYYLAGENCLASVDNAVIRCYKTSTTVIYLDNVGFYSEKKEY